MTRASIEGLGIGVNVAGSDSVDACSAAINRDGVGWIVYHTSNKGDELYYASVQVGDGGVDILKSSVRYSRGRYPACAMYRDVVVEIHASENTEKLWTRVGNIHSDGSVVFYDERESDTKGSQTSIAMAGHYCIEVHKSEGNMEGHGKYLWYRVGKIQDGNGGGRWVEWGDSVHFAEGRWPRIAMNDYHQVVVVWMSVEGKDVYSRCGTLNGNMKIDWFLDEPKNVSQGCSWADVCLTENGRVVLVGTHDSVFADGSSRYNTAVHALSGVLSNGETRWTSDPRLFDVGQFPAVATANRSSRIFYLAAYAGAEKSDVFLENPNWRQMKGLYVSGCLGWFDRANWMASLMEEESKIAQWSLQDLCLPGSHDAGMYTGSTDFTSIEVYGRTQFNDFYVQLSGGARYFDLRPRYSGGAFYIQHLVTGPKLSTVLGDIRRYFDEGHRELAILKFSQFSGFKNDATVYENLVAEIREHLGNYIFRKDASHGNTRLAELPLDSLIGERGAVLVMIDIGEDIVAKEVVDPQAGIFSYADHDSAEAKSADLTVYDEYSKTKSYETMKKDQLEKYDEFNAKPSADLFLLSWTLTPLTGVVDLSGVFEVCRPKANPNMLPEVLSVMTESRKQRTINILYHDYVGSAQATQLAYLINRNRAKDA